MMSEKDSAISVTVNIPRTRTLAKVLSFDKHKNMKKKVFEKVIRKPSDTTIRNYTLPSSKPLRLNALKKGNLLLPYKSYATEENNRKWTQRAAIKLRDAYKIKNTDLQTRLYIENSPNDVQATTDIDENYFRYLNNHSTAKHIPMYKSLQFQFHERLRWRHETSYKKDYIFNIEENYRKEQETYIQNVTYYAEQVKQFDEFVAKDYQRSMVILQKSDMLRVDLNEMLLLAKNLANQQFKIQSRLINLDYLYSVQQKYGRFLYYLSPPSWRTRNREFAKSGEIEAKGFDLGSSNEEDTFNIIFHNMQNECSNGFVKAVLYFTHPDDLMAMFENMEKQHFNHFAHVISWSGRARNLNEKVRVLKSSIQQDTSLVAHLIEGYVCHVNFCEERAAQLQAKFMKILNGLFFDTVAAADVLRLKLNLEFYYEKIYREESLNSNFLHTARALENMYMEYSFKLDALSSDNVTVALKRCIEKEANKIKKAQIATRELRSFDIIEKSLLRAYEKRIPNEKYVGLTAASFSKHSIRTQKRNAVNNTDRLNSQNYSLTESELEYLRLFTDWTIDEDPAKYLRSLSIRDKHISVNK